MPKITIEITQSTIDHIKNICNNIGINYTDEDVINLLQTDHDYLGKLLYWGVFDTEVREMLFYHLAKRFANLKWPAYGDSSACKAEFVQKFTLGAVEQGYMSPEVVKDFIDYFKSGGRIIV